MSDNRGNPLVALVLAGAAVFLFVKHREPTPSGPAPIVVDDQGTAAEYRRIVVGPTAAEDLQLWSEYCSALADKLEQDGRQQPHRINNRHTLHELFEVGNNLHTAGALNRKYPGFGNITADGLQRAIGELAGPLTDADRAKVVTVLRANAAGAGKGAP